MNLANDLERRAQEASERVGLIFEDGREFAYGEINGMSNKTANLFSSLGITKGMRVGIYMQNSPEFVFLMYGCWKMGAVLVPINIMYQEEELRHAIETTELEILITHVENMPNLKKIRQLLKLVILLGDQEGIFPDVVNYDQEVKKMAEEFPTYTCSEKDEAIILFTGGTTGWPKAVITTHDGWYTTLANLAKAMRGRPGPYPLVKPGTPPNLDALPLFHSGGQQTFLFAVHVGRAVLLMRRFYVDCFVSLVNKYKIDNLVLLPTMLYDLVNYELKPDISTVRSVLVTGGQLNPLLRKRFEEKYRIPILQNYGSTEVGHVAGWSLADIREGKWKPGSTGRVYEGVDVEIRNDQDVSLPPGEIGEICVKSRVTVEGYAGAQEDSQLLIKNGWVYTGDIGYLDEDRCLFVVGRKRDMIKCGGFQVWPSEIEDVLLKYPLIKDVCVVGVLDERLGEIPKAFVVLREQQPAGQEGELQKDIIAYCRDNLAHYKVVRAVEFIAELPRGETGKVLKAFLAEKSQEKE